VRQGGNRCRGAQQRVAPTRPAHRRGG
jgi:hypothetical protein